MCGIAGCFSYRASRTAAELLALGRDMAGTLAHRGPDGSGVWEHAEDGIVLAHRRLAILDLSPAGHQPMHSANGRYVVAFNGEIYNHLEIRAELEKAHPLTNQWRGHSDTETLLAAISLWGVEASVERLVGMFAFALWDKQEKTLCLVRDRIGEKPLYYVRIGDELVFASELKALRVHPLWRGEINRDALALFMRHAYIPAPYSIYRGVCKLEPGMMLNVRRDGQEQLQRYWSAKDVAAAGVLQPFIGTEDEACAELERLLRRTVKQQMISDVPLGAFLSGGVDSSAIVALMQAQSSQPVKTFTIGFHEESFDEAEHARAVARHLGTEHTELYVTAQQALAVIPKLPQIYDEPYADSSQIPTFLVSQLTRQHVTVSLSGDGGDELFGGYNRYFLGRDLWRKIGWMPVTLRSGLARGLTALSPERWANIFAKGGALLPARVKQRNPGDKLHKLAGVMSAANPDELYLGLISQWNAPSSAVIGGSELPTALGDRSLPAILPDFTQRMMYLDLVTYLPDDILVKVDRAAMSVSLETRVPFLDHRVVEFAWRLPIAMKIRGGQGKRLLRKLLYQYVPQTLIDRPKMGFGVPLDAWLRGPLKDWAEALLDERRLAGEGFFHVRPVREKWEEHLSGRRNWQYQLWCILMFQAWLEGESAV